MSERQNNLITGKSYRILVLFQRSCNALSSSFVPTKKKKAVGFYHKFLETANLSFGLYEEIFSSLPFLKFSSRIFYLRFPYFLSYSPIFFSIGIVASCRRSGCLEIPTRQLPRNPKRTSRRKEIN